ncbi:MAG: PAS domain S-box protein, partial [Prosthecobacter sp.]
MSSPASFPDASKEQRITRLVQTLQEAERELQELTGGQVDAVARADGQPFLLSEAQKQLRYSEVEQRHLSETQQSILNALPSHIALLDEKGVILAVNEAWRRFADDRGFQSPNAGVGLNYLEVCARAGAHGAHEAGQTAEGIRQVLRGAVAQFELEYPCDDTQPCCWFHLTVTPTGDPARPTGAVVSHQNITESKRAELERQNLVHDLGERVKELRMLYEVTRLLAEEPASEEELLQSVAVALRGAVQFPELAAARVRHDRFEGTTPGHRETVWRLQAGFTTHHGTTGSVEVGYLEKPAVEDDSVFLDEERCLLDTVAGQLRGHFERQRSTAALRLSEATMAEAQRISHFGSWELDLDNKDNLSANPLRWSDETYRIAGLEPGGVEVTNELFFSIVPKEDHAMIMEAVGAALRDGGQYTVTHRMVRPNGDVRVVNEMGKLFVDEVTGLPLRMVGTVHDITEQRRAEESLRRSEQEQRELVRRLEQEQARLTVAQRVGKVGSWEMDVATLAASWSAESHRIFETDPATFQPTFARVLDLVHPADRETVQQAFQDSLHHRELCSLEHRLLLADGRVKHVEARWQIFFDDNGTPLRAIGTSQDITERRQVAEEIEQTAALLRAVADGTPDAIFVKDLEGRYQFFNEGAAHHVGIEVEEVLGRDDNALFLPEDVRVIRENDRLAIASGRALTQEETVTIDGVMRTYLATKAPYHDSSGKIIGLIGISRDISERKQQERQLAVLSKLGRELNTATTPRRAAEIITAAADDLFGWDAASLDLYSTERDEITTVINIDTIDGLRDECSPAYDAEPPSDLARSIITEGSRLILRAEPQSADPASRMFGDTARPSASLMFVPIYNRDQVAGLLSIQSYRAKAYCEADLKVLELLADYCSGALNRIQTEFLREVSEERFREMAENVGDIFYNYAPEDNRLLYANEAFARLWGRPLQELYENPQIYLQHIHPHDRAAVDAALQEQLDGLQTEVEFRILRLDGSVCWVRQTAVPILNDTKHVERIVGTMRDITERRLSADRLAEQAALLDKAHDAIVVRDLNDGRVLFWNKSAERLYGWTTQEALGRDAEELLYKAQPHFTAATATTLAEGEWNGELVKTTKAGKPVTIECHWSLVRDDEGRPKSILMIDTDVTERRIIEQQYFRAQRMESIGTLAGGIAHDLNNVLAPVLMSIELLRLKEKDPVRLNILTTIEQSAKRGADMVQQVLSFARGVEGRQLAVDVGRLITEVQKITNETFLKNIQVEAAVPAGLWIVQGDPTQLHQVLLNLCVNARDAM